MGENMKIAVISANIGDFDEVKEDVIQSIDATFYRFTDNNFPPRHMAMTSRLQARIPKMFGWQMCPGYDYYIWKDSSLAMLHPDSIKWFLEQCPGDIAFFIHPDRKTIQQEADFIKKRIKDGSKYLSTRYANELIDEQLAEIQGDKTYTDNLLLATGSFIYKNTPKVHALMKEWWYHTSRYHSVDQLGLPYAIYKTDCNVTIINKDGKPYAIYDSKCSVRVINEHYMHTPYLTYVRTRNR